MNVRNTQINSFSSGSDICEAAEVVIYCSNGHTPPYGKGEIVCHITKTHSIKYPHSRQVLPLLLFIAWAYHAHNLPNVFAKIFFYIQFITTCCSFIFQWGTREQCILGPPVVSHFSRGTGGQCMLGPRAVPHLSKGNSRTMHARLSLPITLASLNSFPPGLGVLTTKLLGKLTLPCTKLCFNDVLWTRTVTQFCWSLAKIYTLVLRIILVQKHSLLLR